MKLTFKNSVISLNDGTYNGSIKKFFTFKKGETQRFGITFELNDDTNSEFTYFTTEESLISYPWKTVFNALDTEDTDDLVGHNYEFTIKNNTKDGKTFSNITKITVM